MDGRNSTGTSTHDSSQWLGPVSLAKVTVPRFDSCPNVYDFITAYEDATTTLLDEQKASLLIKAFPPDCQRTWFENELKPMIDSSKRWDDIKEKIIDRFASQESSERHLTKLVELKFDPEGERSLMDFIDDMVYSHKRAFPDVTGNKSCIRFIKSALPASVKATLAMNPNYEDDSSIDKLRKAAKNYDLVNRTDRNKKGSKAADEMASMIRDLVLSVRKEFEQNKKENEDMKKDNEATRKVVIAAFESNRGNGFGARYDDRNRSPQRQQFGNRRSPSPGAIRRSPSPRSYDRNQNYNWRQKNPPGDFNYGKQDSENKQRPGEAFNSKSYFARFGVPPTPCPECNEDAWHWARHCSNHLK